MAKQKHIPLRECIGCGEKFSKWEMLRVVKGPAGFLLDTAQKEQGRGAYLCRRERCLKETLKRKKLNRAFRQPVPAEVYEALALYYKQAGGIEDE